MAINNQSVGLWQVLLLLLESRVCSAPYTCWGGLSIVLGKGLLYGFVATSEGLGMV